MQRYKHMLQQQEQVEQRQISVQNWWLHWESTGNCCWQLAEGRGGVSQRKLTTDVVDNQTGNAGDFWTRCKSPRKKHARGQLRTVWLWGASWLGRRGRERRVTAVGGWRGATLMESPQLTTVRRRAQWERERSGNRPNIKFPSIFLRAVKVEQNQKETPKRAPGKVEKAQG